MEANDDELEQFERSLRQFQPRRPRPLPVQVPMGRAVWPRFLAAAAVLALLVGAGFLIVSRRPSTLAPASETALEPRSVALGRLTTLAVARPDRLDDALAAASRTLLPDLDGPDGGLRQLAKD